MSDCPPTNRNYENQNQRPQTSALENSKAQGLLRCSVLLDGGVFYATLENTN
jgi:hypothetical protein